MQNKEPLVPNVMGLKAQIRKIVFSILLLGLLTPAFSQNEEAPLSKTTLQLLHAADMEGGIEALENAPRFSSVLNALKTEVENTVIIGAGDSYIPGPFFAAANNGSLREVLGREGSGRADILMLNAMGFMAGALGNHEFDAGTGTLASLIAADRDYVGTAFPFLSANLDFSLDSNLASLVVDPGQEASTIPNSITKSVVITTSSGEKVGVVGMTTPQLGSLSVPGNVGIAPADPNDMVALAAIVQESVDALTATGINKIILTGHLQQISLDEEIAAHITDVDIIITGGSNTLLADETDRLHSGDTADRPYPILTQSASGEPIAIVGTDGNYRYVGRLVVDFDASGVLVAESIDAAVSGAFVTDEQGVVDTGNAEPAARVVEITEAVRDVVTEKDGNIFGQTSVYLNGNRGSVRTEETNIGNLIAEANLAAGKRVDPSVVVSLKNGGGIRASIGVAAYGELLPPPANALVGKTEGQISQIDIENTLRFNNGLTLLTLSAAELLEVIEHTVAASGEGLTPGRFPQIAGMAFSFDTSLPEGSRVQSLVITDADGNPTDTIAQNGEIVGDADRTFRMVTITFLVDGGDDYPYANFPNTHRVDLTKAMTEEQSGGQATFTDPGTEQDALAEYLAANFAETPFDMADVGPESDERIQNLAFRADSLVVPVAGENAFEVALSTGLNMISLPLMPNKPYTARSFMEKIGATTVIELDSATQRFVGFTAHSTGNGFPIEGGSGYIVNVTEAKSVSFTGSAWQNTTAEVAAAPVQLSIPKTWAFVLRAQLEGISGVTLTVYNEQARVAEADAANNFHAAWADMNRHAVVSVGDRLTIEVRDTTGELIRTLQHEISVTDVHRAFTELRLTPADLIPKRTVLLANYPNPFNPETWLPYQLANDAEVAIRIYSSAGQLVRYLDLGFQQAGYYIGKSRAAYWDGRNDLGERLASGVYFYQLSTPESSATRKMVIMK
ncbi:T9SS type A sorting domain-containing protein [Candidatus Poribacteria bacterium]|nr:T9SS type A sorting domain-containing protein [Candidatus Poribacteria bacterium]MYK93976.1 T9SS type A sorting domain-containing protein [Candidatus Poribacteria bacterium]